MASCHGEQEGLLIPHLQIRCVCLFIRHSPLVQVFLTLCAGHGRWPEYRDLKLGRIPPREKTQNEDIERQVRHMDRDQALKI